MAKNKERLAHAVHNEKVCEYLNLDKSFSDWIVTTAFYSALHFVSYKVFPFEVGRDRAKVTIHDIDQYCTFKKSEESKHTVLADLVDEYCPDISADYDWLKDMSMKARYTSYLQDEHYAQRARTLMGKIKKHCASKADIDGLTG